MALAAFATYGAEAIIEGGGVKALLDLLEWATTQRNMPRQEEVMTACLRALGALAPDGKEESAANLFDLLVDEDGVAIVAKVCFYVPLHFKRILLTILTCPPHIFTFKNAIVAKAVRKHPKLKEVAKSGVMLMGTLALSPAAHAELVNQDGIEAAVAGLKKNVDDTNINKAVANMLGLLATSRDGAYAAVERGGIKALVAVLPKRAAQAAFIEPAVNAFDLIVDACTASPNACSAMREQNILSGVIMTMQDQPDSRVYESGTKAINALLNDEAVRAAVAELKLRVKEAEADPGKKLAKLTAAQLVLGYMATADNFADRIVQLRGPKYICKGLVTVYEQPESKEGRIECLTAGIEACGLLAGKVAASEYSAAVPVILKVRF